MISWVIILTVFQAAAPQRESPRGPRPIPGRGDSQGPTPTPLPPEPTPRPEGCEKTIALQEPPPGSLVESIKEFMKIFAQKLEDEEYRGQIQITWSFGGLHFSQKQVVFSQFTTRRSFIRNLSQIKYLGKGTYIDCALRNMTHQMTYHYSGTKAVLFSVVITDGHVTGSPCAGIKAAADKARDQGIHIFSVAASSSIDEQGMNEIASSPIEVYRDNYIVMEIVDGRPRMNTDTIDQIIKVMVI
ncbi:hypothetical protein XENOCAPTIV_007429 [Xenoophorus captivus]|uniref:VWFA domain-containing protein n=1 Tax=Xenoophorus captivus TaxID=1517983 RepID=A0ABV0R3E9_9TELE